MGAIKPQSQLTISISNLENQSHSENGVHGDQVGYYYPQTTNRSNRCSKYMFALISTICCCMCFFIWILLIGYKHQQQNMT